MAASWDFHAAAVGYSSAADREGPGVGNVPEDLLLAVDAGNLARVTG